MNKVSHFSTPIISRPVFDYFLSVDYFTSWRQPYYVHSLKATTNLRPSRCFRSSDVSWRDAAVWNTLQALRGCASPQVAPAAGVGQTGYKPRSVTGLDQRRRRPARYTSPDDQLPAAASLSVRCRQLWVNAHENIDFGCFRRRWLHSIERVTQCKQYNSGATLTDGFTSASRLPCFYSVY